MKIKDIFTLSFLKLFRSKKNIYIFFIIVLCSLISLFSLTILVSFNAFIENNYYKSVGFRTLNVFYADGQDILEPIDENKLQNINHVVEVFNSKYATFTSRSNLSSSDYNGIITLASTTLNLPLNIVEGEQIGSKKGVAICPTNFYPDSSAGDFNFSIKNKSYEKNIIGQKFKFNFARYDNNPEQPKILENYEKEFEIIGLYNIDSNMSKANQCYISLDDMKEIVDKVNYNNITSTYVFVDSLDNIDFVMNEINDLGYTSNINSTFDATLINNVSLICNIVSIISLSIVVIVLSLYIKKKLINESNNIGIFRSLGYSKSNIRRYYFIEILLQILITYFLTLLIFTIVVLVFKHIFFTVLSLYNIDIIVTPFVYAITFVIVVLVPYFISIFSLFNISNKGILNLMKTEE